MTSSRIRLWRKKSCYVQVNVIFLKKDQRYTIPRPFQIYHACDQLIQVQMLPKSSCFNLNLILLTRLQTLGYYKVQ